ncbi:MAG: hypothetical protein U7126_16555 [Microcoleus sp.]
MGTDRHHLGIPSGSESDRDWDNGSSHIHAKIPDFLKKLKRSCTCNETARRFGDWAPVLDSGNSPDAREERSPTRLHTIFLARLDGPLYQLELNALLQLVEIGK